MEREYCFTQKYVGVYIGPTSSRLIQPSLELSLLGDIEAICVAAHVVHRTLLTRLDMRLIEARVLVASTRDNLALVKIDYRIREGTGESSTAWWRGGSGGKGYISSLDEGHLKYATGRRCH